MEYFSSRARALVSSVLASSLLLASTSPARAADAPAAARPIDEVRLRDGSMVRGIILERSADGDVSLQLPSGETRTYRKADIDYAGAIGAAAPALPPKDAPAAAPRADEASASVSFAVGTSDVRVHVRESRSTLSLGVAGMPSYGSLTVTGETYRSLCIAPCSATLPVGRQQIALGLQDGVPVPVETSIDVKPGGSYKFDYVSNEGTRQAGSVLFWGGIVGASVSLIGGLAYAASGSSSNNDVGSTQWRRDFDDQSERTSTGVTIGLVGGAIGVGLAIAGVFLRRKRDEAKIHTPDKDPAPAQAPTATPSSPPEM